jgi:hypothetical protein
MMELCFISGQQRSCVLTLMLCVCSIVYIRYSLLWALADYGYANVSKLLGNIYVLSLLQAHCYMPRYMILFTHQGYDQLH